MHQLHPGTWMQDQPGQTNHAVNEVGVRFFTRTGVVEPVCRENSIVHLYNLRNRSGISTPHQVSPESTERLAEISSLWTMHVRTEILNSQKWFCLRRSFTFPMGKFPSGEFVCFFFQVPGANPSSCTLSSNQRQ